MSQPRVVLLDIETAPNVGYTWGKYEQNVIEFVQNWFILCFGYKWLGGKTKVLRLTKSEALARDDKRLLKQIHSVLNRADVIIAQNGDAFDIKKINTRLLFHRIPPPSPYKTIDTLKIARQRFAFNSNSLDNVARDLGEGEKLKHRGFEMWKGCLAGDSSAWKDMVRYNKNDVDVLERYYIRLRPWIKNHPNMGICAKVSACPKCGSDNYQKRGVACSQTMVYSRFQCLSCRGWFRGVRGERYPQVTNA